MYIGLGLAAKQVPPLFHLRPYIVVSWFPGLKYQNPHDHINYTQHT